MVWYSVALFLVGLVQHLNKSAHLVEHSSINFFDDNRSYTDPAISCYKVYSSYRKYDFLPSQEVELNISNATGRGRVSMHPTSQAGAYLCNRFACLLSNGYIWFVIMRNYLSYSIVNK